MFIHHHARKLFSLIPVVALMSACASSNAFIMTRLGFTDVSVYTASLQEWAADDTNPMVVDAL